MFKRNKCRYAKERDEYIKFLERSCRIRITRGEIRSLLNLPSDKDIYRKCLLINMSKRRTQAQAIKIKRSKKIPRK